MLQPAESAPPTLRDGEETGKFQGENAATGPIGVAMTGFASVVVGLAVEASVVQAVEVELQAAF